MRRREDWGVLGGVLASFYSLSLSYCGLSREAVFGGINGRPGWLRGRISPFLSYDLQALHRYLHILARPAAIYATYVTLQLSDVFLSSTLKETPHIPEAPFTPPAK